MKKPETSPLRKKQAEPETQTKQLIGFGKKTKYHTSRHNIYMDPDLWKHLKYLAFENHTSVSKILERAAREFLIKEGVLP